MKRALSYVFPKTIPIMTGFLFLGFSLGMLAVSKGFPPYLPVLMALFIFAGSMEFVTLQLLLAAFIGLGASVLCLILFGPENFMIPAMILMLVLFGYRYWQQKQQPDQEVSA